MTRDFTIAKADTDGYITFEMLPLYDQGNLRRKTAERFLKLLFSYSYGALLISVRKDKTGVNVERCVENTDAAFKALAASYPGSVYQLYAGYRIKKLDINSNTSSLLLEIELLFVGGGTVTITI